MFFLQCNPLPVIHRLTFFQSSLQTYTYCVIWPRVLCLQQLSYLVRIRYKPSQERSFSFQSSESRSDFAETGLGTPHHPFTLGKESTGTKRKTGSEVLFASGIRRGCAQLRRRSSFQVNQMNPYKERQGPTHK